MTANKRKVAAAGAAAAFVGIVLLVSQQHEDGGAPDAGSAAHSAGTAAPPSGTSARSAAAASSRKTGDKPLWRALTPAQQLALQPLQAEWDQMDGLRKQKWLQLANRFTAMKPEEQQRVQERMREWVKLTPQQRELARETYARAHRIAPDQKTASWENYQQLTDDQKKQLAASTAGRKRTSVVPSQASGKVLAPLGQGATACPAGTVKNSVSVTPPCVPGPATQPAPGAPGTQPAAPATPNNPPQQEKPVPANWGISPNNA